MSFLSAIAGATMAIANNMEMVPREQYVQDSIRLGISFFKKDIERSKFLELFLERIDEEFRSTVYKIADASDILHINVETLRRKIRSNIIPTIEVEDSKKIVYQVTGDTIIKFCEGDSQKWNIILYYAGMYPEKSIIILAEMVTYYGASWSEEAVRSMSKNISNSVFAGLDIKEELWPVEPVPYLGESFYEMVLKLQQWTDVKVKLQEYQEAREEEKDKLKLGKPKDTTDDVITLDTLGNEPDTFGIDLDNWLDASNDKTIEQLKDKIEVNRNLRKVKMDGYKYDIEVIDLHIEITNLKLSVAIDAQEKLALIEEKLKLVNKKQELAKKMEEFLLQQV